MDLDIDVVILLGDVMLVLIKLVCVSVDLGEKPPNT